MTDAALGLSKDPVAQTLTVDPAAQIQRISTATLIIGVSGGGKTSLLKTYADYLWETYKKVLFLYSWDGGAIPTEVQKAMKQGIIRFWRVRTRSAVGLGIETLYKATKGYVPKHINPMTGETAPAVTLVPPVSTKYTCSCPKGHLLLTVPVVSLIQPTFCRECNTLTERGAMVIREEIQRTKGLELIGGVAFDGLTSMSTVVMDHMDHARGAGDIGGEKSSFGGVVISGDVKLGGNNRADVGFGQSRAQQFVNNSLSIPYLVEGPIFTALSAEAAEEGLPIVGAKLPGRAATDEASSWFGNVLEAASINRPEDGKKCRVVYIRPFVDAQGRKHLLKTSGSSGMPDILMDPPEENKTPFQGFNLGLYFKLLDDELRKAIGDQPPLAAAFAEYGDGTEAPTAPTPVAIPSGMPTMGGGSAPAAALPSTSTSGAAPAPPGMTIPQPRKRNRPGPPQALGTPLADPAVSSPAIPAVAVAAVSPETPVGSAEIPAQAGAPPPPPGARPPMRAPGT